MARNPMAQSTIYEKFGAVAENPMSVAGAVNKSAFLLGIIVLVSAYTWYLAMTGFMDKMLLFIVGGAIAGLVTIFVMIFNPQQSKPLSITYAICEGLALGGLSALYEQQFHGIVTQAVGATFLSLFSMLALYRTGVIRATDKFRKVLATALVAILMFYLFNIVASLMHLKIATVFNSGMVGIAISAVICVVASLCFINDFDFIEKGAQAYAPKYFEWYGAGMLMVTIIWLYLEVLRLLSMLRNR